MKENIEDYSKEFSDVLIPKEKFGMVCALKGYRWIKMGFRR